MEEYVELYGTSPLGSVEPQANNVPSATPDPSMVWLLNASTYKSWVHDDSPRSLLRYLSTASDRSHDVSLWVASAFSQAGAEVIYVDCCDQDFRGIMGRMVSQSLSRSRSEDPTQFTDRMTRMSVLDQGTSLLAKGWLQRHFRARDFLQGISVRERQKAPFIVKNHEIVESERLAELYDILEAKKASEGRSNAFLDSFSPGKIDEALEYKRETGKLANAKGLLAKYTLEERLRAREYDMKVGVSDRSQAYRIVEMARQEDFYPGMDLLLRILNVAMRSRVGGKMLVVLDQIEAARGHGIGQFLGQFFSQVNAWNEKGHVHVLISGSTVGGAETALEGVPVVTRDTERQGRFPFP